MGQAALPVRIQPSIHNISCPESLTGRAAGPTGCIAHLAKLHPQNKSGAMAGHYPCRSSQLCKIAAAANASISPAICLPVRPVSRLRCVTSLVVKRSSTYTASSFSPLAICSPISRANCDDSPSLPRWSSGRPTASPMAMRLPNDSVTRCTSVARGSVATAQIGEASVALGSDAATPQRALPGSMPTITSSAGSTRITVALSYKRHSPGGTTWKRLLLLRSFFSPH